MSIADREGTPRISIVMPVYNAEALLDECLAAVRANEGVSYEVIVVDDSSTDRSPAIAAAHGCRVVPSGGRLGPGRARNIGAGVARGDILFFIDSDVMIRPDTLLRLAEAFEDPKIDGAMAVQAPEMRFRNACSRYKNLWMYHTYARRAGEDVPLFYTTAAAIRRKAFIDSGGFDANYTNPNIEDTDFGQKLARLGYRIRIFPHIEVEHVKGYDLAGLLRVDFLRSMSLARLKLRKMPEAGATNDTSVPTGYIISVPLALLGLAAILAALVTGNTVFFGALVLALIAIVMLNIPFLRLLHRHGGLRSWAQGCGILMIELVAAGVGSLFGIATYMTGQKY